MQKMLKMQLIRYASIDKELSLKLINILQKFEFCCFGFYEWFCFNFYFRIQHKKLCISFFIKFLSQNFFLKWTCRQPCSLYGVLNPLIPQLYVGVLLQIMFYVLLTEPNVGKMVKFMLPQLLLFGIDEKPCKGCSSISCNELAVFFRLKRAQNPLIGSHKKLRNLEEWYAVKNQSLRD